MPVDPCTASSHPGIGIVVAAKPANLPQSLGIREQVYA